MQRKLMENLISKTEAIELFKVSESTFDELVKKENINRIRVRRCTYFDRDSIIRLASELEHRRQIRVTTWNNGQT